MQVGISFFLDGRPLCTCLWWHVPRQGDEVLLGGTPLQAYSVLRVVWGIVLQKPLAVGVQAVRIDLAEIPNEAASVT